MERMNLDATLDFLQTGRDVRLGCDRELLTVLGSQRGILAIAEPSFQAGTTGIDALGVLLETMFENEEFVYEVYNELLLSDWTPADAARLATLRQHRRNAPEGAQAGFDIEIAELEARLAASTDGDRGIRPPRLHASAFRGGVGSGPEASMSTVMQALGDTANSQLIWQDEFEFVAFTDTNGDPTGRYMLVLPGVTDLSAVGGALPPVLLGDTDPLRDVFDWDPNSYTARDTWIAATESLHHADVDTNVYATLVAEFLEAQVDSGAIPFGADIAIVGHSFGADTAVDLAADPGVNGNFVNITHVVAAAYHSEPQLGFVPDHTEVAVIQNIFDMAVMAEAVASGDFGPAGRLAIEGAEGVINVGGEGVNYAADGVDSVGNAAVSGVNGASSGVNIVAEGAVDGGIGILNAPSNVINFLNPFGDPAPTIPSVDVPNIPDVPDIPDIPDVPDANLIGNTRTEVRPNITLVEFEGGISTDIGHHQDRYIDYLAEHGATDFEEFFLSMTEAGYVGTGDASSVDVTVPDAVRNPPEPFVLPPAPTVTPAIVPPADPGGIFGPVFEPVFGPIFDPVTGAGDSDE